MLAKRVLPPIVGKSSINKTRINGKMFNTQLIPDIINWLLLNNPY